MTVSIPKCNTCVIGGAYDGTPPCTKYSPNEDCQIIKDIQTDTKTMDTTTYEGLAKIAGRKLRKLVVYGEMRDHIIMTTGKYDMDAKFNEMTAFNALLGHCKDLVAKSSRDGNIDEMNILGVDEEFLKDI